MFGESGLKVGRASFLSVFRHRLKKFEVAYNFIDDAQSESVRGSVTAFVLFAPPQEHLNFFPTLFHPLTIELFHFLLCVDERLPDSGKISTILIVHIAYNRHPIADKMHKKVRVGQCQSSSAHEEYVNGKGFCRTYDNAVHRGSQAAYGSANFPALVDFSARAVNKQGNRFDRFEIEADQATDSHPSPIRC